ncbi:unnamed protein product [Toxocara canis]|uniref:Nucleotide-diphospho-sugar transferase n=1 Tax=Toxocara canis TaxID=6265 RepID=A0A183VA22_TOXCA|nr:unnamed protein product [Toxocara canis]
MRLSICARGTLLHLCAVTIAIIVLSVIRWAVPSLSGIHKVFPSNVSEHLSVNEFNAWRTEQANGVIARFSNLLLLSYSQQNSHGTEAESAVNVVIVASGREGYFLTQVVAALLELQNTSTLDAAISICDVSETSNDEIDRISQIVPRIKIRSPYLHDYGSYEGRIAKESNDYWLCMNATHNSRYLLLIEDDAVPVPAFGHLLHSIVQRMDSDQKIDFIKLYHPGYLRKLPYYFQVIAALSRLPFQSNFNAGGVERVL